MRPFPALLWLLAALGAARAQIPPPPQVATTSASCAATCTLALPVSGYGQVVAQATGTGSGMTFAFQGTVDSGTTWQTLYALAPSATPTFAASFNANGYWLIPAAAMQQVRVNLTAIGGGTEKFVLSASVPSNVTNP